jgi:hypothetical protein
VENRSEDHTQFFIDAKAMPRCEQSYKEQRRITMIGRTDDGHIRAFTGVVQSAQDFPDATPGRQWRITIANR